MKRSSDRDGDEFVRLPKAPGGIGLREELRVGDAGSSAVETSITTSNFPLLDRHFGQRGSPVTAIGLEMDRLRRIERLRARLDELAHTTFVSCEQYLADRLGDEVECYVEREPGLDFSIPPSVGFRWGPQGGRLNALVFTSNPESGEIHATWRCWRNGVPLYGDADINPVWTSSHVQSLLQELIINFSPI